jgi:hypothetical protein
MAHLITDFGVFFAPHHHDRQNALVLSPLILFPGAKKGVRQMEKHVAMFRPPPNTGESLAHPNDRAARRQMIATPRRELALLDRLAQVALRLAFINSFSLVPFSHVAS